MRTFKKVLLACAAVGTMTAMMASSAFAATYADGKASADMSVAELEGVQGQLTVLVIAKGADDDGITADEILYIDQNDAATEGLFQNMGLRGSDTLPDGDYVIKIGGENLDAIIVQEFTIGGGGTVFMWGDVDANNLVDADDVTKLLRHVSGAETLAYLVDELIARCDVTLDGEVDADDVTRLLRHVSGAELLPEVKPE